MTSATSAAVRLVRRARDSAIAGLVKQDRHRHFPSWLNHRVASVSASIPSPPPQRLSAAPLLFSDGKVVRLYPAIPQGYVLGFGYIYIHALEGRYD